MTKETMRKRTVPTILLSFIAFVTLFDPTGIFGQGIVRQIDAPGSGARGLTWDGQYLWYGDAVENRIFKIDPATGGVIFAAPVDPNGDCAGNGNCGGVDSACPTGLAVRTLDDSVWTANRTCNI